MKGYSVAQLSTMYNCARNTMYEKLKEEEIQPYMYTDNKGRKLSVDGLNVLNTLMGESKVVTVKNDSVVNDDKYVNLLKEQIEELKREKQELKNNYADLKLEYQETVKAMIRQQDKAQKLLEDNTNSKKSWWKR